MLKGFGSERMYPQCSITGLRFVLVCGEGLYLVLTGSSLLCAGSAAVPILLVARLLRVLPLSSQPLHATRELYNNKKSGKVSFAGYEYDW